LKSDKISVYKSKNIIFDFLKKAKLFLLTTKITILKNKKLAHPQKVYICCQVTQFFLPFDKNFPPHFSHFKRGILEYKKVKSPKVSKI